MCHHEWYVTVSPPSSNGDSMPLKTNIFCLTLLLRLPQLEVCAPTHSLLATTRGLKSRLRKHHLKLSDT